LPAVTNSRRFAVVDTGSQIDMALAAELAGVDTHELYQMEPGVNRWATDPDGPHRLLVPAEQAAAFEDALASLGDGERARWTKHEVKKGETIGSLADKYQTTVAVLREVNGLRSNALHAGQNLLIPAAKANASGYGLSADARAARAQSVARSGQRREREVQPGETLWSISRQYGVDTSKLASWNSMAPGDTLSVGRELVVWTKEPAATTQPSTEATAAAKTQSSAPIPAATKAQASAAPSATARVDAIPASTTRAASASSGTTELNALKSAQVRQVTYVVRPGDSLYSIARRFRVTVPDLREWNGVAAEKIIKPGQRLKMFVDVTEQSGGWRWSSSKGIPRGQTRRRERPREQPLDRVGNRTSDAARGRRACAELPDREAAQPCRRNGRPARQRFHVAARRRRRRADRRVLRGLGETLGRIRQHAHLPPVRAGRSARRPLHRRCESRRLPDRARHIELQSRRACEEVRAADARPGGCAAHVELPRRGSHAAELQRDGPREGEPRGERPLSRDRSRRERHPDQRDLGRADSHAGGVRHQRNPAEHRARRCNRAVEAQRDDRRRRQRGRILVLRPRGRHHGPSDLRRLGLQHRRHRVARRRRREADDRWLTPSASFRAEKRCTPLRGDRSLVLLRLDDVLRNPHRRLLAQRPHVARKLGVRGLVGELALTLVAFALRDGVGRSSLHVRQHEDRVASVGQRNVLARHLALRRLRQPERGREHLGRHGRVRALDPGRRVPGAVLLHGERRGIGVRGLDRSQERLGSLLRKLLGARTLEIIANLIVHLLERLD